MSIHGVLAQAESNCASMSVQVDLLGRLMSPNQEDYDRVRHTIGSVVADVHVQKYILKGLGIEGGFTVCIEALHCPSYRIIMQRLRSIKVDSQQTIYNVQTVKSCAD